MNKNLLLEARNNQKEMAKQVILKDCLEKEPNFIAGMDVSNNPFDPEHKIYASVVVLSYPKLEIVEKIAVEEVQDFPYMTGLLAFREAPALIKAFNKLSIKPDLIMCDGHGICHPRGLGIASHLGVILDIPTIGVGKSILIGKPLDVLSEKVGCHVPLIWKNKEVGVLLRTKKRCNPLIISCGHKISLPTAIKLVKSSLKGYRLPEPTRQAHIMSNSARLNKNFIF